MPEFIKYSGLTAATSTTGLDTFAVARGGQSFRVTLAQALTHPMSSVDIVGGTIQGTAVASGTVDNVVIGSTTARDGYFVRASASSLMNTLVVNGTGTLTMAVGLDGKTRIDSGGNLLLGMTSAVSLSGATFHMVNATPPNDDPADAGVLYVQSGALMFRGAAGTITTVASA